MPSWFFWIQVTTCAGAALALAYKGQWPWAWTWFCYSLANLGFVYGVK